MQIGIVDYGAGNLGSVVRALAALSIAPRILETPDGADTCDKLVFPGVGAAGQAMAQVSARGLDDVLRAHVARGRPLLGICVGMQILGTHSEEADTPCLGLLPYRIEKLRVTEPIPHMGWSSLDWNAENPATSALGRGLHAETNVYYVHSYAALLASESPAWLAASTSYGGQRFAGVVAEGGIWATQFHTEKSGRAGLTLLRNFVERA